MLKLIDLDECVINALNLFVLAKLPVLDIKKHHRYMVIGSGNAIVTGKIIFGDYDAVFADESTYEKKEHIIEKVGMCKGLNTTILISASGGKHAPIIAKHLKAEKHKVVLITNNGNALAKEYADKTYVFPKNVEPYTYNTSTYMGMIFGKTKENPKKILNFIKKKVKVPSDLKKYDSYYIIVPDKFDSIREMFKIKFDELFGSKISGRVFTVDQTEHAKTITPSDKELFIGLGVNNKTWGTKRLNVPLPKDADFGAVMAIGYYVIGQIQKQNPQYFKKNILEYTKKVSKLFKQDIKPIVE